MGAILTASVLHGIPSVMLFFAAVASADRYDPSGWSSILVLAAVLGLALLFAHIALVIKIRNLDNSIEKQVPYA